MSDFHPKSVLVTGAAGFIGSNLIHHFQTNYPDARIVAVDRFRSGETFPSGNLTCLGHYRNLMGFTGEVIAGDINDPQLWERLTRDYQFDAIFHQAAISDTTVYDQNLVIQTNLNSFDYVLDLAFAHDANLVYASSGATYGNAPAPQTVGKEDPANVYGYSKLMMDHVGRRRATEPNAPRIVGLRYFNVYGPREYFKGKTASMIVQFGHQVLAGNSPRLFEGSDKIIRDFIYVEDVIQANLLAAADGQSGVYNIGTGVARSFQSIVDILQDQLGTDLACSYVPNPHLGKYQFHTEANIAESQRDLGYSPKFTLEDGIRAYLPEIRRTFDEDAKA